MQRIVVIGTSGSGKSTLARRIAAILKLRHIELDAIHWGPNWTGRPEEIICRQLDELTSQPRWVIDGNYLKYSGIIWPRADTIIWLDYPMTTVFSRVVKRTFVRWWNNEILWSGNRETLYGQLLSKDSLFLWVINTWRKNRRDFPKRLRQAAKQGKSTHRFRSECDTRQWLDTIQKDCTNGRQTSSIYFCP